MKNFHFSPIKNKEALIGTVRYTAANSSELCRKVIGESLPLHSLTIFSHNEDEFESLKELLSTMGTPYNENNGPRVTLHEPIKALEVQDRIEKILPKNFDLDSKLIKVLVLTKQGLQSIVENKPRGFGEQPDKYHSDVIFLMGIQAEKTISLFSPREGVDKVWSGKGVIYSERLSALRTKSRLNKIMSEPEYQFMTIRNWNTTTKLLALSS